MYRVLVRVGKVYLKKDDDESVLRYLNKFLLEYRIFEIFKLILEVSVILDLIKIFFNNLRFIKFICLRINCYFSDIIDK